MLDLSKVRLTKPKLIAEPKETSSYELYFGLKLIEENDFPNGIRQSSESELEIEGVMCDALVGAQIGFGMGQKGAGIDVDLAAAGNSEVVKAKLRIMHQESLLLESSGGYAV
ncbi:MAG TPA: hypothetical protein VKU19_25055 [Bryobacteraceae bacterium]|nr:hypothetical protein [Bryobacteraceae bacterium]